jgi:hypothetical protein
MQSNFGKGVGALGLLSTNSRIAGVNPRSSTVFFFGAEEGGARQTARTNSGSRKPAMSVVFNSFGVSLSLL